MRGLGVLMQAVFHIYSQLYHSGCNLHTIIHFYMGRTGKLFGNGLLLCVAVVSSVPGLELQGPLLPGHLEGVRVVLVGGLQHLHAVDADPRPHRVLGPSQTELGHAVQQHVVELAVRENAKKKTGR